MRHGEPVLSGIRKQPVTSATIEIGLTNIAGDAQADLRAHGGPEKAIFAYPIEHLQNWTEELRPASPFSPGSIGDNLTIRGLDETQVRIGDVWSWGDAVVQICQPRYPCYKLAMATGFPRIVKRFMQTGRSGWYIRVLQEGSAPTDAPIQLMQADPAGVTVREAAMAVFGQYDNDRRLEIAAHPALAQSWRNHLLNLTTQPQ